MRHRSVRRSLPFVIGVALLVGGCGLFSLDEDSGQLRELIQSNREAWEEANIESYRFMYNKAVGGTEQDSVQVTVLGGQIDSVSVGEEGSEDPDSFLTIDRLYDEITNNFERDDRGRFQVNFNEEFSYPERYRMAPGEETRGRGVIVVNFAPLDSQQTTSGLR